MQPPTRTEVPHLLSLGGSHVLRSSPRPSPQGARLAQPLTRMGVSHPPLPGWESRFASSPASPQTEPSSSWFLPRGRRIADPGNAAHVGPSGCTACAGRKAGWSLCPLFAKRTGVGTWPGRGKQKRATQRLRIACAIQSKRFRIAQAIRNPLRQRGCEGLGPFRSNLHLPVQRRLVRPIPNISLKYWE